MKAAPAKKKTPIKKAIKKNKDMFKRSGDLNNDGKVTRSEAKAVGKAPATVQADLNNDGKVTRAEAKAFAKTGLGGKKAIKKKTPAKKAAAKKSPAKKAPAKKTTAKKAPAKKTTAKK